GQRVVGEHGLYLVEHGICARTVEIERRLTRTAAGSADLSRSAERGVDPLDELVDVAAGVYVVRQPRAVEIDRERLARPERHDHCLPLTLEAELRAARRTGLLQHLLGDVERCAEVRDGEVELDVRDLALASQADPPPVTTPSARAPSAACSG